MNNHFITRTFPDGLNSVRGKCPNLPYNMDLLGNIQYLIANASSEELHNHILNGEFQQIETTEDLKRVFSDLMMRFDNSPDLYIKQDYLTLVGAVCQGLLHSYEITINSDNQDALTVDKDETGNFVITPQIGQLMPENGEELPENNGKKLTVVEDVQNFINNKLTWINL